MHFCSECNNMYYIKINNETEDLIYYCRKCGFEDNSISQDASSLCVSKTHIGGNEKIYSQVIVTQQLLHLLHQHQHKVLVLTVVITRVQLLVQLVSQ